MGIGSAFLVITLPLFYEAPGFILKSQIKSPGQGGGGKRTERKQRKKREREETQAGGADRGKEKTLLVGKTGEEQDAAD